MLLYLRNDPALDSFISRLGRLSTDLFHYYTSGDEGGIALQRDYIVI